MFDFFYQHGTSRRRQFRVTAAVCSIGSTRSNDLVLKTRLIAKRHAELRLLSTGVYIQDMGSLSGTWVNRQRVVEYGPLTDLDEVTIGDVSLWLDSKSTPEILAPGSENDAVVSLDSVSDKRPGKAASEIGSVLPDARTSAASAYQSNHSVATSRENVARESVERQTKPSASSLGLNLEREPVVSIAGDHQQLSYWSGIVHEQLLQQMDLRRKDVNRMSDKQLRDESTLLITEIISSIDSQIPVDLERDILRDTVLDEAVGLGPLEQFLNDDDITEIMVNNHREDFYRKGWPVAAFGISIQ